MVMGPHLHHSLGNRQCHQGGRSGLAPTRRPDRTSRRLPWRPPAAWVACCRNAGARRRARQGCRRPASNSTSAGAMHISVDLQTAWHQTVRPGRRPTVHRTAPLPRRAGWHARRGRRRPRRGRNRRAGPLSPEGGPFCVSAKCTVGADFLRCVARRLCYHSVVARKIPFDFPLCNGCGWTYPPPSQPACGAATPRVGRRPGHLPPRCSIG
jgi:hypothetical protein